MQAPVPEGVDTETFIKLRTLCSQGVSMMTESQEKMLLAWDSELNHIIQTEFAPYSKYANDLYQEGVVAIIISMRTEYPDVYESYYQQIITEMKEFLLTKGFTYDCK